MISVCNGRFDICLISGYGISYGSLVAGHGGEEMNDRGIGESAFDTPGIIDKGVLLRVPHGVACVFHQGLCRTPADEEFGFRTSARDKTC